MKGETLGCLLLRITTDTSFNRSPWLFPLFIAISAPVYCNSHIITTLKTRWYETDEKEIHMKIAVAMSGGADSAAAALILREMGHEIVGVHMSVIKEWKPPWAQARMGAKELDIPIVRLDLRSRFNSIVVKRFISEYIRGRTPSPCPVCNSEIKMNILMKWAIDSGCDALATGHYARIGEGPHGPVLLRGADRNKDQSYFLFALSIDALKRLILPMGDKTKSMARDMLKSRGISVWNREESQDICFLRGDYREFLANQGARFKPGPIVDKSFRPIGEHNGCLGYTVGQRKGLGVSAPRPLYVIGVEPENNTVIVGFREDALVRDFTVTGFNNLLQRPLKERESFLVQVRHRAKPARVFVKRVARERVDLELEEPVFAVAPGQAAVLYDDEQVVGGGWIERGDPLSLRDRKRA
jgi:tRNA-specific 2-thiouridylase